MQPTFTLSRRPVLVLAGGTLIALAGAIGWMSPRLPAGPTETSARETSFVAGVEKMTDSLRHLLDGGPFAKEKKNTVTFR